MPEKAGTNRGPFPGHLEFRFIPACAVDSSFRKPIILKIVFQYNTVNPLEK
jgi:hypothetical protein